MSGRKHSVRAFFIPCFMKRPRKKVRKDTAKPPGLLSRFSGIAALPPQRRVHKRLSAKTKLSIPRKSRYAPIR